MSTRKQRVFIGSSSETKELAKKIKEHIESYGNATAWWDDFFKTGDYVFSNLIQKAVSFDFAIMIGGTDDRVIRLATNDTKLSPRDNVYLEYGMFSGILSPNRILFLMHKDCRVASDLSGMMLAQYTNDEDAVVLCTQWLEKQLQGKRNHLFTSYDIEMLPTVGIAVGYFHNFIQKIFEIGNLTSLKHFTHEGQNYTITHVQLIITIPNYVEIKSEEYKAAITDYYQLEKAMLGYYRILIDPKTLEQGELVIYDVPDTLYAVHKTIDFIFGISAADTEDSRFAKLRALDNFSDNIHRLIDSNKRLSRITKIQRFSLPE